MPWLSSDILIGGMVIPWSAFVTFYIFDTRKTVAVLEERIEKSLDQIKEQNKQLIQLLSDKL